MGRRKFHHKDKQRGRNELIADCIEELTGEGRGRKQVSSHIQVLKPFVENDPLILKYLSKEDLQQSLAVGRGHAPIAGYGGGRRMSNYPVTSLPQTMRTTLSSARPDMYSLQKSKSYLNVFEPTEFQMFVQQKNIGSNGQEELHRLHTYAQSVNGPLGADLQMSDWQILERDFPLLSMMHTHRPLDCNILIAEASIAFPPDACLKDKDGNSRTNVELGISFMCNSRQFLATPKGVASHVKCYNHFYENGKPVDFDESSKPNEVEFRPSDNGDGVETQLKFGSKFWAKTLGGLAKRLPDPSKSFKEEVSSELRKIAALQEIVVTSESGNERILVMHWTFRQSTARPDTVSGYCGRASWRKLLLPPAQSSQFDNPVKMERADSFDVYNQYPDPTMSQQHDQQSLPALQSPFEYASSGSALSSATWPTSASDGSVMGQSNGQTDFTNDNSFDFTGGNFHIAYDPNLNFDNFDSSTFNFDTSAVDFAADLAMQDYSQPWCDSQVSAFDGQQVVGDAVGYSTQSDLDTQGHMYGDVYGAQYDQHSYVGSHDHQAYGGAGLDLIKEEDALARLADASYIASALEEPSVY